MDFVAARRDERIYARVCVALPAESGRQRRQIACLRLLFVKFLVQIIISENVPAIRPTKLHWRSM